MITVGMNYHIVKGKEQQFEDVFDKVQVVMGKTEGHLKTCLYRNVRDSGSYLIHSEWTSRNSFEAFTASPQFKNVTDWGKTNILATRPTHEIYGAEAVQSGRCPAHAGAGAQPMESNCKN